MLDDVLEMWTSTLDRREVLEALDQADVPYGMRLSTSCRLD